MTEVPEFDIEAAAEASLRKRLNLTPCTWSLLPESIRAGVRRSFTAKTRAGRDIDNGSIAAQLDAQGFPIDRQVIGRHRRPDGCRYCSLMGVK